MNSSTIVCPKCKSEIPVEEALGHAAEEKAEKKYAAKYLVDFKKLREEADAEAKSKAKVEFDFVIRKLEEESKDERERNKQFQEQIIELTKELRETKRSSADQEIKMQKKLAEEEDKIRQDATKKSEEGHRYKDLEYEKKLQDTLKLNEELKRKLEQGSQQTQGEVLELELEALLRSEFPTDAITEVAKGVRGADITQEVVDAYGRKCGIILWESKNAKWSNEWISKLKEDQQRAKAQTAVLVSLNLPEGINNFTFNREKKIWITNRASVVGLAWAIRINIGQLYAAKLASVGKSEKMEVLYNYLTGPEFVHRVEAIVGAFNNLKVDLEREKKWFTSKWSRQEKEIEKIIGNTQGMYGELQGVTDRSLPEIKSLELESGDTE